MAKAKGDETPLVLGISFHERCWMLGVLPYGYKSWMLGWLMCKTVPYIQGVSVAASVYSLIAVSLDRHIEFEIEFVREHSYLSAFSRLALIRTFPSVPTDPTNRTVGPREDASSSMALILAWCEEETFLNRWKGGTQDATSAARWICHHLKDVLKYVH
uniref:Uncharacterized protein n=1 Tax=Anopheles farauti TaxID=69004 RepID=A0A182QMF0_9DIPT